MSFLFDKLFQKQNPELASEMAKRGLIFDRIKHRWVKNPVNRAQPKTAPKVSHSEITGPKIPGMEGPFSYKTGNSYYYSPKEGKYYDAKSDVFMPTGFDPHTGQYSDVSGADIERAEDEAAVAYSKWKKNNPELVHKNKNKNTITNNSSNNSSNPCLDASFKATFPERCP